MNNVAQTPQDVLNILHTSNDFKKNTVRSVDVCVENLGQRVMYL